jgi:hypothetical protein
MPMHISPDVVSIVFLEQIVCITSIIFRTTRRVPKIIKCSSEGVVSPNATGEDRLEWQLQSIDKKLIGEWHDHIETLLGRPHTQNTTCILSPTKRSANTSPPEKGVIRFLFCYCIENGVFKT